MADAGALVAVMELCDGRSGAVLVAAVTVWVTIPTIRTRPFGAEPDRRTLSTMHTRAPFFSTRLVLT